MKLTPKIPCQNYYPYLIALAMVAPLFSMRLSIYSIAILVAFHIFNYKKWIRRPLKQSPWILFPWFFMLIMTVRSIFSPDWQAAWNILQRFAGWLLIPWIFFTMPALDDNQRRKIERWFVAAVGFFFVVDFIYAVYRQTVFTLTKNGPFNWYFFYRYDFLEPFHQQPVYVAMFALMALAFLLFDEGKMNFSNKEKFVLFVTISAGLLFTGSRQGYFFYFVLITMYVFYQIKKASPAEKWKWLWGYPTFLALSLFIILQIPIAREQIYKVLGVEGYYKYYEKKYLDKNTLPEKQGRLAIWSVSLELIKEKPVTGWGIGMSDHLLFEKYKKYGMTYLYKNRYNAHNTYLQTWMEGGILLSLAYVFFCISTIIMGLKKHNWVLFYFGLLVILFSITETIFRIQGILFIILFYAYQMILQYTNEK